jgi:hypothetical protein
MTTRRLGVLALVALLALTAVAGPVAAVDDDEPPPHLDPHMELPSIDEIGTFLAVLVIGLLYLKWQPEFERDESKKRR